MKKLVYIGLAVAVIAVIAAAWLEPHRIVPGLLAGEPFHHWRPARYWREVLRTDGASGTVSQATI